MLEAACVHTVSESCANAAVVSDGSNVLFSVARGSKGTLGVYLRLHCGNGSSFELDDGEEGRDPAQLEVLDAALDASLDAALDASLDADRLEASEGTLVDGAESSGPHHSGRRSLQLPKEVVPLLIF